MAARRQVARPNTPDAVAGRRHMDVQTENFLEEISDRPAELDQDTQTDAFMDRPPSPLYIPKKTGNAFTLPTNERIFIELMTSDHEPQASREGSKCSIDPHPHGQTKSIHLKLSCTQ